MFQAALVDILVHPWLENTYFVEDGKKTRFASFAGLRKCRYPLTLKGVLIDFGGTLAFHDDVKNREYEAALVSVLKKYGYERRLKDLSSVLDGIYWNSTKGELKTLQEFWSLMLRKLRIPERPELLEALQEVRNKHTATMYRLYDGVLETLGVLKEKYKLALVSNCAIGADKLIHSLGLDNFFTCVILSYQVGVRKPDKRMYLEALKCLKLEAQECAFVADEISDLEGAREIGLATILVRQGSGTFQEAKDMNFKPDFQISQIAEVAEIL
jgi:putative hydrolase of the HAD superfamily